MLLENWKIKNVTGLKRFIFFLRNKWFQLGNRQESMIEVYDLS